MSDTKHTPGEWLAVPGRYAVFEVDDKGIFKEFICWTANNKRTRTPQAAENTKILAASKDMLKALELADPLLTTLCTVAMNPAVQELLPFGVLDQVKEWLKDNKAQAALKKAHGEGQ